MRRFRTHSLAAFGALVILSLSISSVFGARPTADDQSSNFGHQVAKSAHVTLSDVNDETGSGDETGDEANDETGDEANDETGDSEECQPTSDEDATEDGTDEGSTDEGSTDEDSGDETDTEDSEDTNADSCDEQSNEDAGDQGSSEQDSAPEGANAPTAQNHGQCVAAVAQDLAAVGENGTHGWAVMFAAQVTCRLEANANDSSSSGDEDSGSAEESGTDASPATKPHGKSDAAHQRKLDGGSGKPTWAASSSHGGGNGHGHGRNH